MKTNWLAESINGLVGDAYADGLRHGRDESEKIRRAAEDLANQMVLYMHSAGIPKEVERAFDALREAM